MIPTLNEEKKLWRKGCKLVAGLDEAGRGPLAGPVVAGAVMLNSKHEALNSKQYLNSNFQNSKRVFNLEFNYWNLFRISNFGFRILKLRDSKKLTAKAREKFYKILTTHPDILWGIGIVSEKVIDRINILEATKLAMIKAVKNLEMKLSRYLCYSRDSEIVDFLILDGRMEINLPIPQKSIVKADEKVFSCAAASIIAKVTRDRIMMRYHKKFPQYGFDRHKGYGTKYHYQMIEKYGTCQIHRKSFNI